MDARAPRRGELTDKIGEDVREGMEKSQREFLLRQQLAAIRKELGEGEPDGADDYRGRVEAADVPDAVREALLREVDKLERSSDQSPETAWIRTWLDTVLELPWSVTTEDSTDVAAARAVLDADHHGLDEVKERIVEYLAVRSPSRRARPPGRRRPRLRRRDRCWPARPESARPRWASRSRVPSAGSSSASPWAASATRPRSADTAGRTSARCPAGSCGRSRRPAR